ncbi:hypothetical protein OH738_18110 [Streptomyces hirsutus]|uniref:hypothetical protein n=1 Tax=Streptomyces hirsutus TaxID=35620 RepID=UPI00386EB9A6|nr:hypothetical protein OH738_18110 [Streptomyces hirsutus]
MTEPTQTETSEGTPRGYGYCSWHHRFAADVRLIDVIEQGSGPGHVHYACPSCRRVHGLVPYADRP